MRRNLNPEQLKVLGDTLEEPTHCYKPVALDDPLPGQIRAPEGDTKRLVMAVYKSDNRNVILYESPDWVQLYTRAVTIVSADDVTFLYPDRAVWYWEDGRVVTQDLKGAASDTLLFAVNHLLDRLVEHPREFYTFYFFPEVDYG